MDCHQAFYFQLREFGKKGKYRGSFQVLPSRLARLSKLGISLLALIVSLISVSWSVSPIISHPRCHRLFAPTLQKRYLATNKKIYSLYLRTYISLKNPGFGFRFRFPIFTNEFFRSLLSVDVERATN